MQLKVGDKVKFLNEKGGGIVSKVKDNQMVYVTIEDGFDIPVLKRDLIRLESHGDSRDMFDEDYSIDKPSADVRQRSEQHRDTITAQPQREMEKAVFLIFQAEAGKPVMAGKLDAYLFNNSNFSMYYTFYLQQGGQLTLRSHGFLLAYRNVYIDSISREQLDQWSKGWYQIVYLNEQQNPLVPENEGFSLKPKRFYKEENYKNYPGWTGPVFAYSLSRPDLLARATDQKPDKEKEGVVEKQKDMAKVASRRAIIDRHMVNETKAKVDLHIEQICSDHTQMNAMEILNTQLSYFRQVLESALRNNIQELVLIHGVGAGILRAEIRRELQEYDFIEVRDAPIAEYGVGATLAKIYQA
ncbi:MAG: DUF2027 domain-containing protein [Bacteroidales bacterium]